MPETPIRAAIRCLGPLLLLAYSPVHADECACPAADSDVHDRRPVAHKPPANDPATTTTNIVGDKVEYKVNGNMVLSGNVVMDQGDRKIRADQLEYDAVGKQAKVNGGVEYSSPELIVRGNSGQLLAHARRHL